MSFEDELRATMRSREHDAPQGLDVPARPGRRRRRRWLPVAAAAAVATGALTLSVAQGRHDSPKPDTSPPAAPLTCPARAGQGTRVPAAPDDVAGAGRLVPDTTARSVVVCGYVRAVGSGRTTTSSRVLSGDLDAVRDTLGFVPRRVEAPCTADLQATDGDRFLIGLTYTSGTVWVAAPGDHCAGSSNGRFDSHVNLSRFARAAATAGHWVDDPTPVKQRGPCDPLGAGRLGEDTELAPDDPVGLIICSSDGPRSAVTRIRTDFHTLVATLQRTRTRPTDNSCSGGSAATTYTLRFRYARGPDTRIYFQVGCHPDLNNLSVQGDDSAGTVLAEVERLLAKN